MKNKKTAYIMVPIVLAIWGMIGWKVYAAMKDNGVQLTGHKVEEKAKAASAKIPDTISLIANYRDPFLDGKSSILKNQKSKIQNSKSSTVKAAAPLKIEAAWPSVSYHGLVKRASDQQAVGFLSVNGESYFVRGEEKAGEVVVGKIWKDSAEVVFGKEKKVFKK